MPGCDIRTLPIGPQEAFLFSRIDGSISEQDLATLTGFDPETVRRALERLHALGAIAWIANADGRVGAEPTTDLDEATRAEVQAVFDGLESKSYYELLGVSAGADRKELRKGYYGRAPFFHPDRYFGRHLGSFKAKMEAVFGRLTLAYETLSDPERRAEYDSYLAVQRQTAAMERLLSVGGRATTTTLAAAVRSASISESPTSYSSGSVRPSSSSSGSVQPSSPSSGFAQPSSLSSGFVQPSSLSSGSVRPSSSSGSVQPSSPSTRSVQPSSPSSGSVQPSQPSSGSVQPSSLSSGFLQPSSLPSGSVRPSSSSSGSVQPSSLSSGSVRPSSSSSGSVQPSSPSGRFMNPSSSTSQMRLTAPASLPPSVPPRTAEEDRARRETLARRLGAGRGSLPPEIRSSSHPPVSIRDPEAALLDLKRRRDAAALDSQRVQARKYAEAARASSAQGDAAAAANAYRLALVCDPENAELAREHEQATRVAARQLAGAYLRQGDYEARNENWVEAARSYTRAADGMPGDPKVQEQAAQAIVRAGGDPHRAVDFAQRALALAPDRVECRLLLAEIHLNAGRVLLARREIDSAREMGAQDDRIKLLLKKMK